MKQKIIKFLSFIFVGIILISSLTGCNNKNTSTQTKTDNVTENINGNLYTVVNNVSEISEYNNDYDAVILNKATDITNTLNRMDYLSYDDYVSFCDEIGINKKYDDKNQNYIVIAYAKNTVELASVILSDIKIKNNGEILIYMREEITDNNIKGNFKGYVITIPIKENIKNPTIIPVLMITKTERNELLDNDLGFYYDPEHPELDKPIIYIYPETETKVSVKLPLKDKITCSYPKYVNGWNVIAQPNGTLKDIDTGRELYALYYEATTTNNPQMTNEGFVVKGEDSIEFLEEKLAILGLNEKEAEEFIIYWLPILENNQYNYIRFATTEEINSEMPLEISPKPDTTIRVSMYFKELNTPIEIQEQQLQQVTRVGYTIVEWGGCELK